MKKGIEGNYNDIVKKYLENNYIRKVDTLEDQKESKWFLPHFPIYRPEKETSKIRIVFDASAKYQGVALNDFVLKGPKLQQNLFNIICRFRRYPVAIVCDISEMYLQVELAPKERNISDFYGGTSKIASQIHTNFVAWCSASPLAHF